MFRPLLIFGTRPEAIKLAPVIWAFQRANVAPLVCALGQHRELLAQVLDYFGIEPDIHVDLMTPNQGLAGLSARAIEAADRAISTLNPDCVLVHGDTSTAWAGALAAFYRKVPVAHVEAGLRTGDLLAPWPEEMNRRFVDMVSSFFFAPTALAAEALLQEGAPRSRVFVTGNTVVDALLYTRQREAENPRWSEKYAHLGSEPMILVTAHRRESFGKGLEGICKAVKMLAENYLGIRFVFPVHPNPNVQGIVTKRLTGLGNVYLVEPVAYPEMVWLMNRSMLILTDSGGVQEEAPSLHKPVVVLRDTTERPEAVQCGSAEIVGTNPFRVVTEVRQLIDDPCYYAKRQATHNPYGDGSAAERIVGHLVKGRA
ncbi:MAG: UDP-N-acetylglucosamine 2-epimerase (non-hydrolyzing) [Chloroflexota bacterium]